MAAGAPEWVVREDAGQPVLVALYLRQVLGIRSPQELPHLRDIPPGLRSEYDDTATLDRLWLSYWEMTVEPQAHTSPVPLELVDGFDMLVALPTDGFEALHSAIVPHGADAVSYARAASERYHARAQADARSGGSAYRAYASAIAQHERNSGRRAHSFELNVQVLPLTQRGVWWIGALTVAVTDSLRTDIAAFDTAIAPVIADIA